MGRGTKHKCEWKPTILQAVIDARTLYKHTTKIMANEKVFSPANDFLGTTLYRIHEIALTIYMSAWNANRINAALNPDQAADRLGLQAEAIAKCQELLALMELAKSQLHLPSGKVLMFRDPAKVKALKRKMKRLAALIAKGRREMETMDECWECAKACMAEGNSLRLLREMAHFTKLLKEEIGNGKYN